MGNCCGSSEVPQNEKAPLIRSTAAIASPTTSPPANKRASTYITQTDVKNYEADLNRSKTTKAVHDDMLLKVRMWLRLTPYEVPVLLPLIGFRKNKFYFTVNRTNTKQQYMLTVSPIGAGCNLFSSEAAKVSFVKLLTSANNPFVHTTTDGEYQADASDYQYVITYRPLSTRGSLRDMIYKTKLQDAYDKKYPQPQYPSHPPLGQALPEDKIAKFGREILEGLEYLHSQGFPFFNAHTGNVIIDDNGNCHIIDYESDLLYLPPKYLDILCAAYHSSVHSVCVSFGIVLFEMATGLELQRSNLSLNNLPKTCPPQVKQILESIFKPSEGQEEVSLRSLLALPFFANVKLYSDWNPKELTIDKRMKQYMATVMTACIDSYKQGKEDMSNKNRRRQATLPRDGGLSSPPATSTATTTKKKRKSTYVNKGSSTANLPATSPPSTTTTKAAPVSSAPAPPPPPAPGPPPPPPPSSSAPLPGVSGERKQLLSSIEGFSKGKLKKAKTNDRSGPKL